MKPYKGTKKKMDLTLIMCTLLWLVFITAIGLAIIKDDKLKSKIKQIKEQNE